MHEGWVDVLDSEAPKNYESMTLDLLDTDSLTRTVYDVHVVYQSIVDQPFEAAVILKYGTDPAELKITISSELWPSVLKDKLLETWPTLTALNIGVWRHGWCNSGYTYTIWSTQHGILKPFILTHDETGHSSAMRDAVFKATVQQHASVYTHVLPGSVIATQHHLPQVVVTANGQRSACENCDFKYDSDLTPNIQSVVDESDVPITNVAAGTTIVVNFDIKQYLGDFEGFSISIGSSSCVVFSRTKSQAKCVAGNVVVGEHDLILDIPNLGISKYNQKIVVLNRIDSYEPKIGSSNGGTVVSVVGAGFQPDQNITLEDFNGLPTHCNSVGHIVTYNTLECTTVENGDIDSSLSPVITTLSETNFNIFGGEVFTITGQRLQQSDCISAVLFGQKSILENSDLIISWTDTTIAVRSPEHPPGTVNVKVNVCQMGYSNSKTALVELELRSVSSPFSSLMGGKEITLSGVGFAGSVPDADQIEILVHDIPCKVNTESVKSNEVVCVTGTAGGIETELTLTGNYWVTKENGNATELEIEQGQEVHWKWDINLSGVEPKIRFQTVTPGNLETTNGHYWSEQFGGRGSFVKEFTEIGSFSYSTGLIDSAAIAVLGTINVILAKDKEC